MCSNSYQCKKCNRHFITPHSCKDCFVKRMRQLFPDQEKKDNYEYVVIVEKPKQEK